MGALVAVAAVTALYFKLCVGWISLGIVVGAVLVSYIVAAAGSASLTSINAFGEFMRGWLVGLDAGLNGFPAFALLNALAGRAPGREQQLGHVWLEHSHVGLNGLRTFGPVARMK